MQSWHDPTCKFFALFTTIVFLNLLAGCAATPPATLAQAQDSWFVQGEQSLSESLAQRQPAKRAKNVILFIGDGMGISTITAARILEGQQRGGPGEENSLSFEAFPYTGLVKTYNTNQQTPDSAGTATAMLAGVKTKAGVLGLTDQARRGSCASAGGAEAHSIFDLAEAAQLATGLVTTTRITHATPAAAYAHSPDRGWESDGKIPPGESDCIDIARQLIDYAVGDGIDLIFGGGREYFFPESSVDPEHPDEYGVRTDGKNLVAQWLAQRPDERVYAWNQAQFDALENSAAAQVLGLFETSHMQFEADRASDPAGEPSLSEMTAVAIRHLSKNPKGFFLLVEGGRIDHGHHDGNAYRALTDTIEFSNAVRTASQMTNSSDTLVVVTADHGHTLRIVGYPTRGNPILGLVINNGRDGVAQTVPKTDMTGLPYTTLAYSNGPGYHGASDHQPAGPKKWRHEPASVETLPSGRADLGDVDTQHPDYLQEAGIATFSVDADGEILASQTHSGGDVAVFASGPGAHLLSGVHEQNYIFHVMRYVQGL